KLYLQPFTSKQTMDQVGDQTAAQPIGEALFETRGKTHNEWVKQVAYSLVNNWVKDEVFQLCGCMCLHKPEFAEQLFTFSIFDISQKAKSSTIRKQLSNLCQQYVLANEHSKRRSIRLVL